MTAERPGALGIFIGQSDKMSQACLDETENCSEA